MNLDRYDREILIFLDEYGSLSTEAVARKVERDSHNKRKASQLIRQRLLTLEKAAYVERLTPTSWMRTEAGTLALNNTGPP